MDFRLFVTDHPAPGQEQTGTPTPPSSIFSAFAISERCQAIAAKGYQPARRRFRSVDSRRARQVMMVDGRRPEAPANARGSPCRCWERSRPGPHLPQQTRALPMVLTPTHANWRARWRRVREDDGNYLDLRRDVVFGGVQINPQMQRAPRPRVAGGTPGRLMICHQQTTRSASIVGNSAMMVLR